MKLGIDVELRNQSGAVVDAIEDTDGILGGSIGLLSGTRLLCYLVPWGDAVFNQAQAADLLTDMNEVSSRNEGSAVAGHLTNVRPLVEHLSRETHYYLWFMGD